MKILQVFDFFSPYGGGTVDVLYKLSKGLERRGHKITICTSDTKDYKFDQEYINSLPNVEVRVFHCWSNLSGFYIIPSVVNRIDVRDYDLVHFHCFRSFQNIVLSWKARRYHIPYIIDAHGSAIRQSKGNLKRLYDAFFTRGFVKGASKFVAETTIGFDEYKAIGVNPDKIEMIHPPFDISEFERLPSKGQFKSRHNILEPLFIMYLGRIHQTKGLDFLIKSFMELCLFRDDAILLIAGNDDGYEDTLWNMVESFGLRGKVLFAGFISRDEKLSALVDADVLVQPSENEQGARPSFEAILCGTPAIVCKNTGAGKDIGDIDAGYQVDYGDILGMREAIRHILDNPQEAQAKVQKGEEWIKANLSLERQIEKYEQLYREVMGK